MPYTIKPANILDATADVLVVPHSSDGQLFKRIVTLPNPGPSPQLAGQIGYIDELSKLVPKTSALGDITVIAWPFAETPRFKYLVFACIEEDQKSTYTAIRKIAIRIMQELSAVFYGNPIKMAVPALGTTKEHMSVTDCCRIFFSAAKERTSYEPVVDFYTVDKPVIALLTQKYLNLATTSTSLIDAIKASILAAKRNKWVADLAVDEEFYFSEATKKFQEFESFKPEAIDFFQVLQASYTDTEAGFLFLLRRYPENSQEYKFLTLCGELLAYVARNAYNKKQWNLYPDKRTIGIVHIHPYTWTKSLINYRISAANLESFSPVIKNAIKYLKAPKDNLIIFLDGHRKILARNTIGYHDSSDATIKMIFDLFVSLDVRVKNPANTGALFSRILLLPEIKELWQEGYTPLPDENGADTGDPETSDAEQTGTSQPDQTPQPDNPSPFIDGRRIEAKIHSDIFSDEDLLNYNSYARAISQFIAHRNTTPPLTIGVLAPWGKGKTTLMRFIQKNLKEITRQQADVQPAANEEEVQTTYGQFMNYLKTNIHDLMEVTKLKYPTIWFNAWNYQKNEQVWAGFAHEIINQLIGQLPTKIQQEKAWLALNLRRLDRQRLRGLVYKKLFGRFLPAIGVALLGLLTFFLKIPIGTSAIIGGPLLGIAIGIGLFIKNRIQTIKLDFDLYKYVRQPNYQDKLGYLHTVKEDLRLALDLLVDNQKPAVIFIDDLDRCSPSTTGELVEAINAFISGDLPYCYFIIGQDAQMVAAALDSVYKDVGNHLRNLQNGHGSLGWFFMEKFMQLQFNIPIMQNDDSQRIMRSLFKHSEEEAELGSATTFKANITRQADKLLGEIDSYDNEIALHNEVDAIKEQLLEVEPQKLAQINNKIVDNAANNYDDQDDEVSQLILDFSAYLTTSPRMVKRFVNLYRFHRFLQFTGQNKEMRYADAQTLAKWIIIMIKWPQLVRAIQWDTEKDFENGSSPMERAGKFELDVVNTSSYETWRKTMQSKYKDGDSWLTDRGLYDFLRANYNQDSSLSKAVEYRFW